MKASKYVSFRLVFSKRIDGLVGLIAITALKILDNTGESILRDGVASASTEFSADYNASKAFDGNDSTRWASASSDPNIWIRYDLTTPKYACEIFISLNNNPVNGPKDFVLEGLSEDNNWEVIHRFIDFATALTIVSGVKELLPNKALFGVSKLQDGSASRKVVVLSADTFDKVAVVVPNINGAWSYTLVDKTNDKFYFVAQIGSLGYRPILDGPIMAENLTYD